MVSKRCMHKTKSGTFCQRRITENATSCSSHNHNETSTTIVQQLEKEDPDPVQIFIQEHIEKRVIVGFTASWCNPCKRFKSILYKKVTSDNNILNQMLVDKNIQLMYNDTTPVLIITDPPNNIMKKYRVQGYPSLLEFNVPVEIDRNELLNDMAHFSRM
jgi:thiol:disulfide interchange protein